MRNGTVLLVLFLICSPVRAEQLKAKVEYDDLSLYKRRIAREICSRTVSRLKELHMTAQGSLVVKVSVFLTGETGCSIEGDDSANLGLVVPNVVDKLAHNKTLKFPEGLEAQRVLIDLEIQPEDDFTLTYSLR